MAITPIIRHLFGTGPLITLSECAGAAVAVDGSESTSSIWPWASGELDFEWWVTDTNDIELSDAVCPNLYTFGDPRIRGRRKYGPRAAFFFAIPNILGYRIHLRVTDPVTRESEQTYVVVAFTLYGDPELVYVDGNAAGDGVGTIGDPCKFWDTALTAINAQPGNGVRILRCARGSTIIPNGTIPAIESEILIEPYGVGALPIVSTTSAIAIRNATAQGQIHCDQLDVRTTTAVTVAPNSAQISFSRCKMSSGSNYAMDVGAGARDLVLVDCELVSPTYVMFMSKSLGVACPRRNIDGCTLTHSVAGPEALVRAYLPNGAFYGCALNVLKKVGIRIMAELAENEAETYVGLNTITMSGAEVAMNGVQMFSTNGGDHSNIVCIANDMTIINNGATAYHVEDGAEVTNFIAKNEIYRANANGFEVMGIADSASLTPKARFLNCTIVNQSTGAMTINPDVDLPYEMKNCIYEEADLTGVHIFELNTPIGDMDVAHNWIKWDGTFSELEGVVKGFDLYGPNNINGIVVPSGMDPVTLKLTAGSILLGHGLLGLPNMRDHDMNVRPVDYVDTGAFQYSSGGAPPPDVDETFVPRLRIPDRLRAAIPGLARMGHRNPLRTMPHALRGLLGLWRASWESWGLATVANDVSLAGLWGDATLSPDETIWGVDRIGFVIDGGSGGTITLPMGLAGLTSEGTIVFLVKLPAAPAGTVQELLDDASDDPGNSALDLYVLKVSSLLQATFETTGGQVAFSSGVGSFPLGQWNLVGVDWGPAGKHLYIQGRALGTAADTVALDQAGAGKIGFNINNAVFGDQVGRYAWVALWDRQLAAGEHRALAMGTLG